MYQFSLVTFLVVMSSTFLSLGTGARPMRSVKWTGFYNSHLYPVILALVSYSHGSCGVIGPVSSSHFLQGHHTVLCLGWTEMSPHSLSLVCFSSRFHLYPWECSWQMGSPLAVMLSTEHAQRDLYGHLPCEGLSAGVGVVDFSLVRLVWHSCEL